MSDTLSKNETIKEASRYLRGTIAEGLDEAVTGGIVEDDQQLTKFHGIYLQDDRDLRPERRRKRMERAFGFMVRVRVPGGVTTPAQWLEMDRIADAYGTGTLRLTTRQAFQFHGIIKTNLKRSIQAINASLLDTLAACGDVNRNVICNPIPHESRASAAAHELARALSEHLLPQTPAYHEIWLEGEKILDTSEGRVVEPIYGATYLPRKFKIAIAVPPSNDVDVLAHDLGYIAIVDKKGSVVGYNVSVGGGMGMTHGEPETFPRLAEVMAFCAPGQAVDVAEKVVTVQRDFGDRANRKHARLKYTIEDRGLEWFRAEVERRLGYALEAPRSFRFESTGDQLGWTKDHRGRWNYAISIENGRVKDTPDRPMKTGLKEIARVIKGGDFRLTPNQNLMIAGISPRQKPKIERLLKEYGLTNDFTGLRLNAMACVALPTCGLALTDAERYLPSLVTELEEVMERAGLRDDAIVIRMTGCPNGCARPYIAEIGLVGRNPGRYNLYLGAAFDGTRLNKLYRADVDHAGIVAALTPLIESYAKHREDGERFGDFVIRQGHIKPTTAGNRFHADLPAGANA
jgi:sulfite reductase (NADPH) hemoprotein beta-component